MAAVERTPLIANDVGNGPGPGTEQADDNVPKPKNSLSRRLWSAFSVENRILFAGFLITLSFTFTASLIRPF